MRSVVLRIIQDPRSVASDQDEMADMSFANFARRNNRHPYLCVFRMKYLNWPSNMQVYITQLHP
ncbi:hypothetical protein AG1IA_08611 [Rhizoctonia solani AG-1 IA]|uniref:Uncharacterized protein n=1 Tax=Thanatephorus cucumeris (strain AG1-IA) TaxID=983506 RepID=L8WKM1_THACA|nr:hypothetical protein AG1IA_08611 [Rhizoctonia solani AG-1 IA]